MANCRQLILSQHPDAGDDEGGEDEDGGKFPGPDGFVHHDGSCPGHGYFHDESDEAGGQTEQQWECRDRVIKDKE